jgi:glutamate decarboxylase
MALSKHIDPDELLSTLSEHPHHKHRAHNRSAVSHQTPYSTRYNAQTEISKYKIPHDGAPADAVHQMLKDELDLDGRPNLNLASFVGTYMEKEGKSNRGRGRSGKYGSNILGQASN